jgi:2-haloalkanoic acid dehalogenase type II
LLLAFTSVEKDIQVQEPTLLYSGVLAKSYDELSRRLSGQTSAPDVSGNTSAEVQTSNGTSSTAVAGTSASEGSSSSTGASTAAYSDAAQAFAASIAEWNVFPDTIAALAKLSSLGLKLVVLSNVDRSSFGASKRKMEQGFTFDHVFTAEEIGSYKPNLANHRYALVKLGSAYPDFKESEVLCVAASLTHDHVPAQALGLGSVWIVRSGAIMGQSGEGVPETDEGKAAFVQFKYDTMEEFADAMSKAHGK